MLYNCVTFVHMEDYITIRVSQDFKKQILEVANENQVSMSSIVKIAVTEYLNKNKSKKKNSQES